MTEQPPYDRKQIDSLVSKLSLLTGYTWIAKDRRQYHDPECERDEGDWYLCSGKIVDIHLKYNAWNQAPGQYRISVQIPKDLRNDFWHSAICYVDSPDNRTFTAAKTPAQAASYIKTTFIEGFEQYCIAVRQRIDWESNKRARAANIRDLLTSAGMTEHSTWKSDRLIAGNFDHTFCEGVKADVTFSCFTDGDRFEVEIQLDQLRNVAILLQALQEGVTS
jgi:hypothetical protein